MKLSGIVLLIFLKILLVENVKQRMPGYKIAKANPNPEKYRPRHVNPSAGSIDNDRVIGIKNNNNYDDQEDYDNEYEKKSKKPCAVVVLSNIQNPAMQSLLRRYRYDSNGILIPSSVKYFIKLPQGIRESPLLVPLNDKAFSPVGGFVRYYKEVPPIPHTW